MSSRIPAVIIGASGYVGGELLRLIAGHPNFELAAAVSDSVAGKTIGDVFGHLATAFLKDTFVAHSDWLDQVDTDSDLALFSAAPHGASAAVIAAAIDACEQRNINVHVVDSSAPCPSMRTILMWHTSATPAASPQPQRWRQCHSSHRVSPRRTCLLAA